MTQLRSEKLVEKLYLTEPHPLDVCILLVAHTAHHPVVVHGVHYVWLRFRPLQIISIKKNAFRY